MPAPAAGHGSMLPQPSRKQGAKQDGFDLVTGLLTHWLAPPGL